MIVIIPLVPFKGYIGPVPLSAEVFLIPLLTAVFLWEWVQGRIKLNDTPVNMFLYLFGIFLLVQLISLSQAVALLPAVKEIVRYISYVVLFYIVMKVRFTQMEYRHFAYTFLGTLTIAVVYGLFQFVFDFNLNKAGLYALDDAWGRVPSTMVNPNYWGGFINFVLPVILLVAVIYVKKKPWQLVFFGLFSMLVINQLLTYTRSAWVIMVLAIILTALMMPKMFFKKFLTVHLLIATLFLASIVYHLPDVENRAVSSLLVIQSFIPIQVIQPQGADQADGPAENLKENKEDTSKAVVSRTTLWKTGWYMWRDHPVIGVGIGNYYERYKDTVAKYPELDIGHDRYSVHNSYLKVAAETGTIGLISFLLIYLYYYVQIGREYIRNRDELLKKILLIGLFIGSGTFLGQNLANNLIFIPQVNVLFWLVSGLLFNYVHSSTPSSPI